ncbi:MAG: hypothetical protein RDV48_09470 [Candidatus Eremiobacteraeota bacterium]|nr:hypothetical protein [Candidatus Eremiobacteraeota bacterium]
MSMARFRGTEKGVTLLELLVAMIVMLIGLFVVFNLFPRAFAIAYKSRAREIAFQLARTKIERIFAQSVAPGDTNLGAEFCDTFNGTGASNSHAATSYASTTDYDTLFSIYSTDIASMTPSSDYRAFESAYYSEVPASDAFKYRAEVISVSDPHLIYSDTITRRITIYVAIPPIDPSNSGFSERIEMDNGNIVTVGALKTNRNMYAALAEPCKNGDSTVYVASKDESCRFPVFYDSDDSRDETPIAISSSNPMKATYDSDGDGYIDDKDFDTDYYKKYYNETGATHYMSRSVYETGTFSYPMEVLNKNLSPAPADYLFNFYKGDSNKYTSPIGSWTNNCDPANFSAMIFNTTGCTSTMCGYADTTNTHYHGEPIQIVGKGIHTIGVTRYSLALQNPLQKAPYNSSASEFIYPTSGTYIVSWIYLTMYR